MSSRAAVSSDRGALPAQRHPGPAAAGPVAAGPGWGLAELDDVIAGRGSAGRLLVRYQPVVSAVDGEPLGAEALVRWQRPDGSLVPPDAFVGMAEAHGSGGHLDEVVLHEALRQLVVWDAAGIRVHRVSVNIGRTSVERDDLAEVVTRACARAGADPGRLILEVLEHDRLHLDTAVLARLQDLADAGVTIAIDDFGSGYAGLGLLGRLPLGLVKLDRSLLPGSGCVVAAGAPAPEALLRGVVALAAAVGAEVTAEGVETPEQWAVCSALGVAHLQGWLFSPAVDADAIVDLWRGHRPTGAAAPASAPGPAVSAGRVSPQHRTGDGHRA